MLTNIMPDNQPINDFESFSNYFLKATYNELSTPDGLGYLVTKSIDDNTFGASKC